MQEITFEAALKFYPILHIFNTLVLEILPYMRTGVISANLTLSNENFNRSLTSVGGGGGSARAWGGGGDRTCAVRSEVQCIMGHIYDN